MLVSIPSFQVHFVFSRFLIQMVFNLELLSLILYLFFSHDMPKPLKINFFHFLIHLSFYPILDYTFYMQSIYCIRGQWENFSLAYNRCETEDKRPLGRDPDSSWCHFHTSLKKVFIAVHVATGCDQKPLHWCGSDTSSCPGSYLTVACPQFPSVVG